MLTEQELQELFQDDQRLVDELTKRDIAADVGLIPDEFISVDDIEMLETILGKSEKGSG